jgi:hypothetical protein
MKKKLAPWASLAMLALFGACAFTTESFAQDRREGLLRSPLKNVQMQADNIGLILSRLSNQYDLPIGFEVAIDDDLSITRGITIEIKDGTVQEVLDSIVNQNPIYKWEIRDDVINVFPRDRNRDILLKEMLETRLENVSFDKQTTRFMLRQMLCENAAVMKILEMYGVKPANETFTSRDFGKVGRDFSFYASNVSIATVLNRVIRDSPTKYWIIMRFGDKKQYLVLNL